ncbi:MAG: transcription termination/antitermination protein NusG [Verrucomicrobiaceae bacterium]
METDSQPAWYVLRSQVKREGMAARNLAQLEGVEVFLPKLRYLKTTRRGKVWWVEPLFPGYLLAKFDRVESARAVTHAHGVSHLVGFGDQVPAVPEGFVESLRAEVAKYQRDEGEIVVGWKVEVGAEVEIADGPFKGMEGKVVEVRPAAERVSLLLDFLGEEHPVEVDLYSLILSGPDLPEGLRH